MLAVTGATGRLGRQTVAALLAAGVPAAAVVAVVRDPAAAAGLAARGVRVRLGDYDRPETLAAALAGVRRLLLVSSNELGGRRVGQHRAVVAAAARAGVELLAYTSIANAATAGMRLAAEHRATELFIRDSGVPFAVLRNAWYLDSYIERLPHFLRTGVIAGCAGTGRISAATRADLAGAAAAVLAGPGHQRAVYELGGETAFTMAELAAAISAGSGRPVRYRDLPAADYARMLARGGLPAALVAMFADADGGVARGELFVPTDDLRRLLGRPPAPWPAVLSAALAELAGRPPAPAAPGPGRTHPAGPVRIRPADT